MKKLSLALLATMSITFGGLLAGTAGTAAAPSQEDQIKTLEKKYFQHDFKKESIEHRLTRLEKFTFGDANKGTVEGRLARLNRVVEQHRTFEPRQERPATKARSKVAQAPEAAVKGDYPHITFLEDELLGKEYKGEAISNRLARLEKHTFGRVSTNSDLSTRTDSLERYAVTTLHKRPFTREKVNHHRKIRRVSHFPLGFSSVNPDDIAASSDTPPPPHSRMLARIAWCEKHTLGRTYPELHLLQRLHQLNAHLFPKDHEKDIQLMDRVDVMVKKVVLLQHPPKTAYRNR